MYSIARIITDVSPITAETLGHLVELSKLQQNELPWFERSLSTIGVVAFFSMIIATGVQTFKATIDQLELASLKYDIKQLENQKKIFDKLIPDISRTVLQEYRKNGYLFPDEKEFATQRIAQLDEKPTLSMPEIEEMFNLSIATGDLSHAVASIRKNSDLLMQTDVNSLMILAEYNFHNGASNIANQILDKVRDRIMSSNGNVPDGIKFRFYVLDSILEPNLNHENYVGLLAGQLGITKNEAKLRLESEIQKYKKVNGH
ncbi:hypothetical protein [Methylomonas sp. YC3]